MNIKRSDLSAKLTKFANLLLYQKSINIVNYKQMYKIKDTFYFPKTYQPYQDFDNHNKILCQDGIIRSVNYTFKMARRIAWYQKNEDLESILKELGLSFVDSLAFLENFSKNRFITEPYDEKRLAEIGLKVEDVDGSQKEDDINFDIDIDFDAYYYDFYNKLNIDLLEEDIPYLKFLWLLEGLIEDENTRISKRISYRTYKPQKNEDAQRKIAMNKLKDLYSISPSNYKKLKDAIK